MAAHTFRCRLRVLLLALICFACLGYMLAAVSYAHALTMERELVEMERKVNELRSRLQRVMDR